MFRRGGHGDRIERRETLRLDRDLREIVIEERCSYGAELRSELVREHARLEEERRSGFLAMPTLRIAAAILLLLTGSLVVPETRAAMLGLIRLTPAETGATLPAPALPSPARGPTDDSGLGPAEPARQIQSAGEPDGGSAPAEAVPSDGSLTPPLRLATLPELVDRNGARLVVAQEYPALLQRRGIGGRVRLLMWVGEDGTAEFPQIDGTSGLRELDLAALRATRLLRFVPATRLGEPVGTWVSFSIRFQPGGGDMAQPDPDFAAFHIPLSN